MKKLDGAQKQIIAYAQHYNYKIYRCIKHGIFFQIPNLTRIEDIGKCNYCSKKCKEFDTPKIKITVEIKDKNYSRNKR